MLLLLTGQYLLYLIHFVLTVVVINHVLMLRHHALCWSIVGLKQMHLGPTSIISQAAISLDRFNIFRLLLRLFLHLCLNCLLLIQNMNLEFYSNIKNINFKIHH